MAKHRSHSIEFKRQVAQEFIAGGTLHALSSRHDVARNLIRIGYGISKRERSLTTRRRLICFSATRPEIAALERISALGAEPNEEEEGMTIIGAFFIEAGTPWRAPARCSSSAGLTRFAAAVAG